VIEDNSRLDDTSLLVGIKMDQLIEVLRVVNDQGAVNRLTVLTRPSTSTGEADLGVMGNGDERSQIVNRFRDNDP
jgi:hypothetical protein